MRVSSRLFDYLFIIKKLHSFSECSFFHHFPFQDIIYFLLSEGVAIKLCAKV